MAEIAFEHVSKAFRDGTRAVEDLHLTLADGEFVALVGASGCGKSTALRMVAGLEDPTDGRILIDGESMAGVAPPDRDVAMVFQSYALYPHLTVEQNIGFPLQMARIKGEEARRRIDEAARMLGIENLLKRKPGELSGGQRQRVAMGRAIVRQPRGFLMDEPLSNLDAKLRTLMRAELINTHRRLGVTTLYVTHDQVEAMTLSDRVAVMHGGVVQQVDAPARLYRAPANTYVAGFVGSPPMNFLPAVADGEVLRIGTRELPVPAAVAGAGEVVVGVRPETWQVGGEGGGAGELALDCCVEILEELGSESIAYLRTEQVDPVELSERPNELQGTIALRAGAQVPLRSQERVTIRAAVEVMHVFGVDGEALAAPRDA